MLKKAGFSVLAVLLLYFSATPAHLAAQPLSEIKLPAPQTDGGKPLMQALHGATDHPQLH